MSIDFNRAKTLMELIHQVTVVSPRSVNLLGLAAEELAAMEEEAKAQIAEIAKDKANDLAAAQERINAALREQQEREAEAPVPQKALQPVQVMPGEPIPPAVQKELDQPGSTEAELSRSESPVEMNPVEPTPDPAVIRRNI